MSRELTTCIYCGCGCGLYLESDGSRVVSSVPSKNHPVSKGSLCVKGWNSFEFINSRERLTSPLVKKKGRFVTTSWDEAFRIVGERLNYYKEKFGGDSLAFLTSAKATNEENYLMMKLSRAVFGTNNVDHCARLCHASTVAGLAATMGSGAMTNSIEDFEHADCFLVTGSDTTGQHPLIGSRIIKSVQDRGAKLLLFDPRKIRLSKYAYLHARIRGGTDVAWINGLMHIIIRDGLEDREYIRERTEGYDRLKKVVERYDPGYVEKITGVPAAILEEAAHIYATTKRAMIVFSMGITQHAAGVDNVKSLANLAMLTGHVGFPATGVNPLRGQNNVQGACDMGGLPDVYSGYQKVVDPVAREKFRKAWGVDYLPEKPGLTITEMFEGACRGKIKAIYIMGENPALSDPDLNHVRRCIENVEFLVVQDLFLSETARYADVVFPASSFAEKDGTFTNTERRVQRIRKVMEPVGNSMPDWKIISGVAKAAGYAGMGYTSPKEIMDEIASLTPIYGGITYERLEPFGLQWPCPSRDHPGTPYLHKDRFTRGKGLFLPAEYREPPELPDGEYPFLLTTGRTYWHFHTGTMTRRTSTLTREVPENYIEMHPEDARRMGIRDGEMVKVSSRRGEINVKVRITEYVASGSVFIPFHFKESAANLLTIRALDPEAKIPELKVCAVKIEKSL